MNDFFNYFWIIIVNISAIIVVMVLILKMQLYNIKYRIQQLHNDVDFIENCDSIYWKEEIKELDALEQKEKEFI